MIRPPTQTQSSLLETFCRRFCVKQKTFWIIARERLDVVVQMNKWR